jgi:hypothetical protein
MRWTSLYFIVEVNISQERVSEAWRRVKANDGTSRVDEITIDDVESHGKAEYLADVHSQNAVRIKNS